MRLDWLEPASPRSLRLALRDGNYHAIHYVGHSDFTAAGNGVIYLEDPDDGNAVEVDETLFANLLSDQNALRLVVLNSCEGARTTLTDPYAGVATTLVQLGVPAVVAMQFEISDRAAIVFAEELYTNLIGRRDPIDASVSEARKAIYSDVDKVEWATPVLFVRDPDVELFRFGAAPVAPTDQPPPEPQLLASPSPRVPLWQRPRVIAAAAVVAAALIALVVWLVWPHSNLDVATDTTTTATSAPVRTELGFPSVRVGDDGAVVVALQRLLTVKDHPVPVTGFFDDATEEAAKALEQETNIPPDGIVGRVTWQQLAAPIRRGDSGPAVLAAEELLQLAGFDIIPDDRFTNGTQDLVVQFQQRQGLPVDGIVDIDTWRVLLALAFRDQKPPLAASPPTTTTLPAATSVATSTSVATTTTPTT